MKFITLLRGNVFPEGQFVTNVTHAAAYLP